MISAAYHLHIGADSLLVFEMDAEDVSLSDEQFERLKNEMTREIREKHPKIGTILLEGGVHLAGVIEVNKDTKP